MAHVGGQKYKIIAEYQILAEYSDENHPINASQMAEYLAKRGLTCERKSVYKDMTILEEMGIDLIRTPGGFYIGNRTFQLPELKLLVDAVGASKFISETQSKELIDKITSLASKNEASQLARQVIVCDRDRYDSNRIFYAIDVIYQCIDEDRQMSFQYEEWNVKKEKVLRHNGEKYRVSPAFLLRNNENYYLVAHDEKSRSIRHYRVDKIVNASMEEEARGGGDLRKQLNPQEYARTNVSMFSGQEKTITVRCKASLVGVLIDKFGTEIAVRQDEDLDFIKVRINVAVSPQFYGWLVGIQGTIVAPQDQCQNFKNYLYNLLENFTNNA